MLGDLGRLARVAPDSSPRRSAFLSAGVFLIRRRRAGLLVRADAGTAGLLLLGFGPDAWLVILGPLVAFGLWAARILLVGAALFADRGVFAGLRLGTVGERFAGSWLPGWTLSVGPRCVLC